MTIFSINPYKNWRKDFARFERELSQHRITIWDCAVNYTEILIYVKTSHITEEEIVTELARKHFGLAYGGLL